MDGALAMTVDRPLLSAAPFLHGNHEQAIKLRKRLEDVFGNVWLAQDVVTVCLELGQTNAGDFNREIAHVLQRCAADRLRYQMKTLTKVIERLGGRTIRSQTPVTKHTEERGVLIA
jgi:hypothetical protein